MQTPPDRIVLDTQVVMDWLVFREASIEPLVQAVSDGSLSWIGHPDMLAELRHVLGRGVAAAWAPDLTEIEACFERLCEMQAQTPAPAVRLLCRDPDDQIFIDLALAAGARWLVSRDRAVLALARRARKLGLEILTPAAWIKCRQAEVPYPAPDVQT
ncbi:MAG: putative toxin-antitoxin system toxin component, PIN family [Roseateles asaccharophilus]|uniref:Putative PIN family toxin of toxin-antitoxin system n=1 Tax=Roseateles asaccharophilus TaxID=582607 RepID=A0A4R6N040_9BURK|nr:PIN domain-containing protein [Roseateles asaccharophilus]MDN3544380.1 PIN domain-containing protein [Roseateles asaccharophilus]TDP06461.1 putative PIN family toxin of toxin-antitoxin system [Roseateles asaccharophilus]